MVSVICKDGKFLAKGTFKVGIVGTFENKEYGEGNIEISYNLEEFIDELNSDYKWMEQMKVAFADIPKDGDSIAKGLEDYINAKEVEIQKNIKQINDYFLYRLIQTFVDLAYPFWEVKEAILTEFLASYSDEDFEKIYDNVELDNAIAALCGEFENKPNDGSLKKTDVEKLARSLFPMFDFDKLIQSLVPKVVVFFGSWIDIEFNDTLGRGSEFYCAAAETFEEDFTPREWHNF